MMSQCGAKLDYDVGNLSSNLQSPMKLSHSFILTYRTGGLWEQNGRGQITDTALCSLG